MNDPERIWLEPECCVDPAQGRLWCQDKAWIDDDCQMEPTEYVRSDIAAAEITRLRARVAELEAALGWYATLENYYSFVDESGDESTRCIPCDLDEPDKEGVRLSFYDRGDRARRALKGPADDAR